MGVGVIKTDFSEAVPEDAVYYDGRDGVEGHNRLTYLYAETIYRWMEEYKKETGELPMLWGLSLIHIEMCIRDRNMLVKKQRIKENSDFFYIKKIHTETSRKLIYKIR